ncbi:MAG: hypothetical protein V2A54_05710 [Bacteroidota bacterium]
MKKFILLALVTLSIASCRKDIDLTADYKEITVIYGLIDPADSIQFIRVSKAFLGDGNAYQMAAVPDSSNYGDEMQVSLEKYEWGGLKATYQLKDTILYNKESGLFPSPAQKLYYLYTPLGTTNAINSEAEYRIIAKNTTTGNEAYAKIKIVKSFAASKPAFLANTTYSVNFAKPNVQDPNVWDFITLNTKWVEAVNGRSYELIARFFYNEEDAVTHIIKDTCVDWSLGSYKGSGLSGEGNLECEMSGENFFTWLASKLEVNPNIIRHIGKSTDPNCHFDFIFTVGGDEITTYMETNEPSNGVLIEKPDYTNIVNGYGVFSCRYNKVFGGRKFDLNSQNYLKTGSPAMQSLNFQ